MPPVTADSSAGDVRDALPQHGFVDVSVALQNAKNIVPGKEIENLIRVGDTQAVMSRRDGLFGCVRTKGRDQGNVNRDDDRCPGRQRGEIGGEPLELSRIDPAFVGAVRRDADRVQHDEVVALVIEGVVQPAEALLEELLAVERVVLRDAARRVDAENVVIANRVIHLHAKILLGLVVKIEERQGTLLGHGERVEDVIAAVDGEVRFDRTGFLEGHIGADYAIELGLQMRIGDEEEGKWLLHLRGWRGCGWYGRGEERRRD